MTKEQANKLATISTRYNELHSASKDAARAIDKVKGKLFAELISEDELETLVEALEILHKITDNTSQHDAVKYFMEIEKLQK